MSMVHRMYLRLFVMVVACVSSAYTFTIEQHPIYSKSMQKTLNAIFILPDSYAEDSGQFPVVYLLHGAGGSYESWTKKTSVASLADKFDVIIVCPDGEQDSWYFDSPIDKTSRFETHIANEVVNFTDRTYRTIRSRTGRVITGLSMGGHGGLFIGARHSDVFGAAGSMSGGVDIRPFPNNWNIAAHIGTIEANPQMWDSLTTISQFGDFPKHKLAMIIDCGLDDFFLDVNRALHQRLIELNIEHEYIERPGAHTWEYWNDAVKYQLFYFGEYFQRARNADK